MVFLQTRGGVETWSDAIIDGRTANYVQNSNTNIFRQKKENKMFACVLRQLRDVPEGNPIRKIEMEKLNVWVLFGSNDLMATASLGSCTLRRCINKGRGKEKKYMREVIGHTFEYTHTSVFTDFERKSSSTSTNSPINVRHNKHRQHRGHEPCR